MDTRKILVLLTILGFTLLAGGQGAIAEPIADFTGGTLEPPIVPPPQWFPGTFGWSFSISSPLTVSALGFFDVNSDGLIESHQVGLWTPNVGAQGTLLAQVTVDNTSIPVASTSSPAGRWLFTDLPSPITLSAGDYALGAYYGDLNDRYYGANATTAAGITYLGGNVQIGFSGLDFPGYFDPTWEATFGPNLFRVSEGPGPGPSEVPEPCTMLLLGSGLIGLWGTRRKFRR